MSGYLYGISDHSTIIARASAEAQGEASSHAGVALQPPAAHEVRRSPPLRLCAPPCASSTSQLRRRRSGAPRADGRVTPRAVVARWRATLAQRQRPASAVATHSTAFVSPLARTCSSQVRTPLAQRAPMRGRRRRSPSHVGVTRWRASLASPSGRPRHTKSDAHCRSACVTLRVHRCS